MKIIIDITKDGLKYAKILCKSVEEICTKLTDKYNYTLKCWRDKA